MSNSQVIVGYTLLGFAILSRYKYLLEFKWYGVVTDIRTHR